MKQFWLACALMGLLMSHKKILIPGGAGFVGSHLCENLLKEGAEIYCLDNFSTGSRANVEHLVSNARFHLIEADVITPIDVGHIDEIYNLACPASPPHYQKDPVHTLKTSVIGALNLLELAHKYGAKILQASTSEVYGDPLIHPQVESYWGHVNPIGPRSCYDEGKRCAETLFFDYHRSKGVRIKVARIFNTYGPRMAVGDGRVVSNFVVQALAGQPITIYGDGSQTRSFCYIDDLVRGLKKLMASADSVTGPINIGNPAELKVGELAAKVVDMLSSSSSIVYHPLPVDDPHKRKPDISQAEATLSWTPQVSLDEGLTKTIAYFAALRS